MADIVFSDDGIKNVLRAWITRTFEDWDNIKMRLYTNAYTPDKAMTLGSFTEATFNGYAAVSMAHAKFPDPTVTSHVASSAYIAVPTFTVSTSSSPELCYGYYWTDTGNTIVYGAAEFDSGPYLMTNPGDTITEVPTITMESKHG